LPAVAICLAMAISVTPSSQAAVKVFKNCIELNKVYPGGVAMPGAINSGGKTKKTPKYNKVLYLANQKSDRDKDGIACEK
jgi:Excalibur calcium-binding domain